VKNKVRRGGQHNKDKIKNSIKRKVKEKQKGPPKRKTKSHRAEKNIGQEKLRIGQEGEAYLTLHAKVTTRRVPSLTIEFRSVSAQ
jgi:hypothetical protein